jgi:hypothetical protein
MMWIGVEIFNAIVSYVTEMPPAASITSTMRRLGGN